MEELNQGKIRASSMTTEQRLKNSLSEEKMTSKTDWGMRRIRVKTKWSIGGRSYRLTEVIQSTDLGIRGRTGSTKYRGKEKK
jgi:hypothetical protein